MKTEILELIDNIETQIKEKFPDYYVFSDDDEILNSTPPLPAIFINLTDFDYYETNSNTAFQVSCNFEAYIMLDFKSSDVKRQIKLIASKLAALVHNNKWGYNTIGARFKGAYPDDLAPALENTNIYKIEWEQYLYISNDL